jgi:hypothetical protein
VGDTDKPDTDDRCSDLAQSHFYSSTHCAAERRAYIHDNPMMIDPYRTC